MRVRVLFLCCITFLFFVNAKSQTDSVAYRRLLKDVTISAFRSSYSQNAIPASIDVLDSSVIDKYPITNFDNILQSVAGVYVNRSWGIFSKNSSVTMRGMDGTARVLVLFDGVPLNKSAGGGINWHIISPWQVERVEIIKGPQSAVYGNNSMAGIINIESRKPVKKFEGNVGMLYGSYGTYGGRAELGGNYINNSKGFYWTAGAFGRKSNGYINSVLDNPDSTAVKLFLEELSTDIKFGYSFSPKTQLSLTGKYYTDHRGDGIKYFEPEGSFYDTKDKLVIADFKTEVLGTQLRIKGYYNSDDYYQHSERISGIGGLYKLYDVFQVYDDAGLIMHAERKLTEKIDLVAGYDFKTGNLDAEDVYRTSLDNIHRYGSMISNAAFMQVFWRFKPRWMLHAGIRYDAARFFDSGIKVLNPSSETGFTSGYEEVYMETNWNSVSPKLSVKFFPDSVSALYLSFNQGYMPPKIDDLCSSRKISKGFKIANPNLKPETVLNFELGYNRVFWKKTKAEMAVYYSIGKDFQYFVETGTTTDDGITVYMRRNVAEVRISGAEITLTQVLSGNLYLKANYAYNYSVIQSFEKTGLVDLKGMELAETPFHQAFTGVFYSYKKYTASIVFNYIGKQWADETNSAYLDPYYPIDLTLSAELYKGLQFSLAAQNLLNQKYIDKKGLRAPGLYVEGNLMLKF